MKTHPQTYKFIRLHLRVVATYRQTYYDTIRVYNLHITSNSTLGRYLIIFIQQQQKRKLKRKQSFVLITPHQNPHKLRHFICVQIIEESWMKSSQPGDMVSIIGDYTMMIF